MIKIRDQTIFFYIYSNKSIAYPLSLYFDKPLLFPNDFQLYKNIFHYRAQIRILCEVLDHHTLIRIVRYVLTLRYPKNDTYIFIYIHIHMYYIISNERI